MSTYLACFIVSDFVAVTKEANGLDGRTFPISVYTTRAQQEKGSFALEIGVKIIEYYINLFNIDYPLPKLGMLSNLLIDLHQAYEAFTSTVPARGARAPNRAISNSCL